MTRNLSAQDAPAAQAGAFLLTAHPTLLLITCLAALVWLLAGMRQIALHRQHQLSGLRGATVIAVEYAGALTALYCLAQLMLEVVLP